MKRHFSGFEGRTVDVWHGAHRRAWPLLLAGIALAALPVQAGARQAEQLLSNDHAITSAVKSDLRFEMTPFPNRLDVNTRRGIVTLSGTINNLWDRRRVVQITENVRGVLGVVDQINVTSEIRPDSDIRKDVLLALLNDPATASYQVSATVHGGVVTLTGQVGSAAEKRLAQSVSESVRGVKDTRNELRVDFATKRTDDEIAADVLAVLRWDAWLDGVPIQITVHAGHLSLAGTVDSVAQKARANRDAQVNGVVAVDDDGVKVVPTFRDRLLRRNEPLKRSDPQIAGAIKLALQTDPRTSQFNQDIEVTVEDGVAILDGAVENLKARSSAGQDAMNVAGVSWVDNQLAIRPTMNLPGDEATSQGLKDALHWDPRLAGADIRSAVFDHVAYLNGTVDSPGQKVEADEVASRIRGVVEIRNYLTLIREPEYFFYAQPIEDFETFGEPEPKGDAQIKRDIERAFFWSPFVHRNDITVRVEGGVAKLTGTVGSWVAYEEADRDAHKGGAKEVINRLHVD